MSLGAVMSLIPCLAPGVEAVGPRRGPAKGEESRWLSWTVSAVVGLPGVMILGWLFFSALVVGHVSAMYPGDPCRSGMDCYSSLCKGMRCCDWSASTGSSSCTACDIFGDCLTTTGGGGGSQNQCASYSRSIPQPDGWTVSYPAP